ncbi:MAG: hydrophobic protein [Candidatus Dormibacteraceae bacterium]
MIAALIVLVVLLVIFGLGGVALHFLWYLLIAAIILWLIGFFLRGAEGRGRWYRW